MKIKQVLSRIKKVFGNKKAALFIDSGIKVIIAVIIGGVVLGGAYTFTDDVIMPTSKNKIISMFDGPSSEQSEDGSSQTSSVSEPMPHKDQSPENKTIGIDSWGKPVNMDLWEYTKDGTNRVLLNDSLSSATKGYIGHFIEGKIIGQIPAKVKFEDETIFRSVTSLKSTFQSCKDLVFAPIIPDSITNLSNTFTLCTSLLTAPVIPSGTTLMGSTFLSCIALKTAPYIPSSVTNLASTFLNCKNLTGNLVIDANPSSFVYCFVGASTIIGTNLKLSGNSSTLSSILATKSANSNISLG